MHGDVAEVQQKQHGEPVAGFVAGQTPQSQNSVGAPGKLGADGGTQPHTVPPAYSQRSGAGDDPVMNPPSPPAPPWGGPGPNPPGPGPAAPRKAPA